MKFTALLLLLIPTAACAQYSYDYTSGPIFSTSTNTTFLPLPMIGSDITGIITLSQELPESGTVTVTPLTTEFMLGDVFSINATGSTLIDTYTFTTQDGMLTSFSLDEENPPFTSIVADSASNNVTVNVGYSLDPSQQMTIEGTAGTFSGPGLHGAPEIDPDGAVAGLTLLIGMLTVMRGRGAAKANSSRL